ERQKAVLIQTILSERAADPTQLSNEDNKEDDEDEEEEDDENNEKNNKMRHSTPQQAVYPSALEWGYRPSEWPLLDRAVCDVPHTNPYYAWLQSVCAPSSLTCLGYTFKRQ